MGCGGALQVPRLDRIVTDGLHKQQKDSMSIKKAACVLITNGDRIVVTTRRDSTQVGLPGGKVDPGETPLQAAVREVFEETGIVLAPELLVLVFVDVCEGDVDYETSCYVTEHLGEIPGSQEDDIVSRWGDASELLTNSPFVEYNQKLLTQVGMV